MNEQYQAELGLVGLGVMGRNLALNIHGHDFKLAVWDQNPEVTKEFLSRTEAHGILGTAELAELLSRLARPRRLLLMIPAGLVVDDILSRVVPLLEAGDVVIDAGNSSYVDTVRRAKQLEQFNIDFVGMGVSGGEVGARTGPSLMLGCSERAWMLLRPLLEQIAARAPAGPCVSHLGPNGAGHFVKMVHNGIEYADMQLIAESYDLLVRGLSLTTEEAGAVFEQFNQGPLASFLIEISAKILKVRDNETGRALVELVQDQAGQKGTGAWTVAAGLELGVPIPTITAAVEARNLSSMKGTRVAAGAIVRGHRLESAITPLPEEFIPSLERALLAARLCSYAQGFALIHSASERDNWHISPGEVARIWTGGCIIRAAILNDIILAVDAAPRFPNLLMSPQFEPLLYQAQPSWRRLTSLGHQLGIPVPAFAASLSYFDSIRTARLPQNLIQAQRDAFGAHTYVRADRPELGPIHSNWLE